MFAVAMVEKGLQNDLGRERVAESPPFCGRHACLMHQLVGLKRRKPFVEEFDRQVAAGGQLFRKCFCDSGLRAARSVHVERQADDQAACVLLRRPKKNPTGVSGSASGALQRCRGLRDGLAGVGDRQSDSFRSVVDAAQASLWRRSARIHGGILTRGGPARSAGARFGGKTPIRDLTRRHETAILLGSNYSRLA